MNTCQPYIIKLIAKEKDSIIAKTENDKQIELNAQTIYDLIESTTVGKTKIIFVNSDSDFPSLDINIYNLGNSVEIAAKFVIDYFTHIPIMDKSSNGIMKWLLRVLNYTDKTKLFKLDIGDL